MKTLITETDIRDGVARLADDLAVHYGDQPVTIIGVLTGSVVLLADLIRRLEMPLRIGLVYASSYRGEMTTRGPLTIDSDMLPDIAGRNVILVDDIFDTGHTLAEMLKLLGEHQPKSIRSVVLLRKLGRQEVNIQPDHAAFEIPDEFVVGYGLDYNDAYRNLRFIAVLEPGDLAEDSP